LLEIKFSLFTSLTSAATAGNQHKNEFDHQYVIFFKPTFSNLLFATRDFDLMLRYAELLKHNVIITDVTSSYTVLSLMGPKFQ
jgi:hypothetical protein